MIGKSMRYQYLVTSDFGPYKKGDHITDIDEMEKWGSTHPAHMVRKVLDEEPNQAVALPPHIEEHVEILDD
jgi:hypothetical protein